MKRKILLLLLCLFLCGCSVQKKKVEYETYDEYVTNFVTAINNKDIDLLNTLLNENAKIFYDSNYAEVALGRADDVNSHLYYLLEVDTRFNDNTIIDGASEYVKILETSLTNHIYKDIYKVSIDEKYYYEFVIEDNEIVYIYVYHNTEEAALNEKFTEAQIGIEYSIAEDMQYLLVTTVYEGSVAYVMDMVAGDKIYTINDTPVSEMNSNYDEPSSWLCGEAGTKVKLQIQREGQSTTQEIFLTRQKYSEYQYSEEIEVDYYVE
ncbi:MAG: PDZ domain-containing protein [Erysipelotrichales bacterium]|nr:PDZ domain-containing protein [Erysipelotrichales bacterium]